MQDMPTLEFIIRIFQVLRTCAGDVFMCREPQEQPDDHGERWLRRARGGCASGHAERRSVTVSIDFETGKAFVLGYLSGLILGLAIWLLQKAG
jgi:hypothetical protein